MTNPIVHIIDDDMSVRKSLRWLIESVDLEVGCYESANTFLDAFQSGRPGCLILDVRMPGLSGLDLQESMVTKNMTIPIIIVTGHADVPMAIRAMKNGAFDFIEKPYNDQYLLDRVQEAIRQSTATHTEDILQQDAQEKIDSLTPREKEVMNMVAEGLSNKKIASRLQLSVKTVETHRANVMFKMKADSLPALIKLVMKASNQG